MARIGNEAIAAQFDEIADLLDLQGANTFRIRAYRNAALTIRRHGKSMADLVESGADLSELPGIGEDLAEKIAECVKTGTVKMLRDLRRKVPPLLLELLKVPRVGPKRANILWRRLKIRSLPELYRAAREGRMRKVKGLGAAFERALLGKAEQAAPRLPSRRPLAEVAPVAELIASHLRRVPGAGAVTVAGSVRRGRQTIGDIDIVAVAKAGTPVIEAFTKYKDVAEVFGAGETRATVILKSGLQADLRVVAAASYGSALQYFTGSKAHSIALRRIAQRRKLKLNEYGVYKGRTAIAGRTEESVYAALGLPLIVPELRENRGEIEAAQEKALPELVTSADLKGDLHVRGDFTERATVAAFAEAARSLGYEYIALALDSPEFARRLRRDEKAALRAIENTASPRSVRILRAVEAGIDAQGNLDLPQKILVRFDVVIGAVRGDFGLPRARQTSRLLYAMENPALHILALPARTALPAGTAYDVDSERIIAAAAKRGVALEIGADPARADSGDLDCRKAKEAGVPVALSANAEKAAELAAMRYALLQARRGWAERGDVLNALPLAKLLPRLKKVSTGAA